MDRFMDAPVPANLLDYPSLIDEAMRGVVRKALLQVAEYGLPGDHHFYVSFSTVHPGVHISPQLRERYPHEMTIVMQHQFWDLDVQKEGFSIMLSFNNIPEKLVIPYTALTAFADPSIKFGLQFHAKRPRGPVVTAPIAQPEASFEPVEPEAVNEPAGENGSAQVISLDAFRKK